MKYLNLRYEISLLSAVVVLVFFSFFSFLLVSLVFSCFFFLACLVFELCALLSGTITKWHFDLFSQLTVSTSSRLRINHEGNAFDTETELL